MRWLIAQHLGQLGRDHDDRLALVGERVQQLVDLALGADVDAARRLVEEQDVAIAQQPFGDHDLLLVAAREQAHLLLDRRRLDVQPPDEALGRGARGGCSTKPPNVMKRRMLASAMLVSTSMPGGEAEVLAVFGQVADAVGNRMPGRAN